MSFPNEQYEILLVKDQTAFKESDESAFQLRKKQIGEVCERTERGRKWRNAFFFEVEKGSDVNESHEK